MSASRLFVVFFCLVATTHAVALDGLRLDGLTHNIQDSLVGRAAVDPRSLMSASHMAFPQRIETGRKLAQTGESTCAWDPQVEQCLLSVSTVQDLLEDADNPLANYLDRAISCSLPGTQAECVAEGCEWHELFCEIPHEEFREFVSAECLEDVEHIIEVQAGNLECNPLRTVEACETSPRCAWNAREGCFFDRWMYFHGIPTMDGMPEGYDDVLEIRATEINAAITAAINEGNVTALDDFLEWLPPAFECPEEYDQVLCDYIEALTPYLLTQLYCNNAYPGFVSQDACNADAVCNATDSPTLPCDASPEERRAAQIAAEKGFTDNIEDEESRKFLEQILECAFTDEESECDGNCAWIPLARVCGVSPLWAEREVYRVVGDSEDPVCRFYTAPVTTGCIDIDNQTVCEDDRLCVWSGVQNTCGAGIYSWLDIALEGEPSQNAYENAEDACFGNSMDTCGLGDDADFDAVIEAEGCLTATSIDDLEEDMGVEGVTEEDSLTSTTRAIGGSTVIGVFI